MPEAVYDGAWGVVGPELLALLRSGFDVLVHYKGGLGRAGTIAAQLLVELGMEDDDAITLVREARPGAIENAAQERYVRWTRPAGEDLPSANDEAITDRALGSLLGLAIGDALGTTLEFSRRDSQPRSPTSLAADRSVCSRGSGPMTPPWRWRSRRALLPSRCSTRPT